jgi:hypothetical protein
MAGPLTQSESQVIHRRIAALAVGIRGLSEEAARLIAENGTFNFPTNLDPDSRGNVDVADATACMTEVVKFLAYWDNATVAATTGEGNPARRAAYDPYLLAEPLL